MEINKILSRLGIANLNAMQKAVTKEISESSRDVVVLSPTGSGKTLAYMLPLQQHLDADDVQVQMLVITPGRELSLQSHEVFQSMKCGLKSMACYGGRAAMDEHRRMREVNPQVIFATPGRLLDHLEKGNILADAVQVLVIDEFDKCLEMGFAREMQAILGFIPEDCRRILLSATDIDAIPRYVNMGKTARLDFLPKEEQTNDRVMSYVVKSEEKDKLPILARLLTDCKGESTIVFLNYRESVQRVSDYLRENGFHHTVFHGGLDQRQRERSLHQFGNASSSIMVCTDLAARGIDIPSVRNIIHYHLPLAKEEFIHRVGRTARWDASGNTFFILGPAEHMPEFIDTETEDYSVQAETAQPTLPKMVTVYIGKGKKDKLSKGDIVGFICKGAGLKGDDIGKIDIYDRYTYVAVSRKSLKNVLRNCDGSKIKGMKTTVQEIKL